MGKGIGLACGSYICGAGLPIYWTNMPHSGVQVKLDRSGGVTVFCGSTDIGQGSDSILAYIVAEVLGVDPFEISIVTTAICVLVGYPLAYTLSQMPRRAANLCMIAVMLPFWTSLLVRTYAWLVLLQRRGLINTWGMDLGLWTEPLALVHNTGGTLIGMVHIMLPFFVLPLYGAMRTVDRELLQAAANLGASPTSSFLHVFLPLSLPGLSAGGLIVFILCLGFYVTPAVLGGGKVTMVSNRIANDIELFFNWGAASALGVVLLVLSLALLYLAGRLLRLDGVLGGGHDT